MFWILVMILLCVIAVGVLVYRQDNTTFSKETGYSLFDILFKSKPQYFNSVMTKLDSLQGEHKILLDMAIPYENKTIYVDAVILHESGIYVMNGVEKKGWIAGRETQQEWIEMKHKEQKKFDNPIQENKQIISTLQELLPEVDEDVFRSLVVFSDACSFQKVELQSIDVDVLKVKELKQWAKQVAGQVLSKEDIHSLYRALSDYTSFTKKAS